MLKNKVNLTKYSIISVFVGLYVIVATISMLHAIKYFGITNSDLFSVIISIAYEVGAGASLAVIMILDKLKLISKIIVVLIFVTLMLIQIIGNTFYAYSNIDVNGILFKTWTELLSNFGEFEIKTSKLLLTLPSALLPIIATGFIKSLVDYMPHSDSIKPEINDTTSIKIQNKIQENSDNVEFESIDKAESNNINDISGIKIQNKIKENETEFHTTDIITKNTESEINDTIESNEYQMSPEEAQTLADAINEILVPQEESIDTIQDFSIAKLYIEPEIQGEESTVDSVNKKGRPKGSKNKPKQQIVKSIVEQPKEITDTNIYEEPVTVSDIVNKWANTKRIG